MEHGSAENEGCGVATHRSDQSITRDIPLPLTCGAYIGRLCKKRLGLKIVHCIPVVVSRFNEYMVSMITIRQLEITLCTEN